MPDYRLTASQSVVSAGFRCCKSDTVLSDSLIQLDSQQRRDTQSTIQVEYNPANEVEIVPGVFMDIYEYPNML